jgi:hypothetical protein
MDAAAALVPLVRQRSMGWLFMPVPLEGANLQKSPIRLSSTLLSYFTLINFKTFCDIGKSITA